MRATRRPRGAGAAVGLGAAGATAGGGAASATTGGGAAGATVGGAAAGATTGEGAVGATAGGGAAGATAGGGAGLAGRATTEVAVGVGAGAASVGRAGAPPVAAARSNNASASKGLIRIASLKSAIARPRSSLSLYASPRRTNAVSRLASVSLDPRDRTRVQPAICLSQS